VLEIKESHLRPRSLQLIRNVVDTSKLIFDQVDLAIKPHKLKAAARLMWTVNKQKALELKAKMESLKSTLSVLLQTVALDTLLGDSASEYVPGSQQPIGLLADMLAGTRSRPKAKRLGTI